MNRHTQDVIGVVMAAVVIGFVIDTWSDGALARYVRERLAVPTQVPTGRDEVLPASVLADVMTEARRITREASDHA